MSDALQRYKALVDQLRGLSPTTAEPTVTKIDEQLKAAWASLGEAERVEAEAYWRSSTTGQIARPQELN